MWLSVRQILATPGEPPVGFGGGSFFTGRAGVTESNVRTGRATVWTSGVTVWTCGVTAVAISGGLSGVNRLADTTNATTETPSATTARRLSRALTRPKRLS